MNKAVSLKKWYHKQSWWLIGIAVGSVLLMWALTSFSSEMFLYDDNRNQWMPIMDEAYQRFFATGMMPNYDFFQGKGLEIADEGYYSLNNPVMLLSYILYRFVFMQTWGSTITFYTFIMVILGNITAFLLCRALGLNQPKALLVVLTYSSCSAFYMFGYWYYIFNNYWIVPLLLYVIQKLKDTRLSYIACGLILAFDLLLGNVQYTVYHYCMYALIMLCMGIFSKRNNFLKMLTNCMTGIVLSIPQLVMMMQSSLRSGVYSSGYNNIFQSAISLKGIIIGMFVPGRLFGEAGNELFRKLFDGNALGRDEAIILYAGGFAFCLYGLLIVIIHCLIQKYKFLKTKTDSEVKEGFKKLFYQSELRAFYIGIFVSMLFFALYLTANVVAHILSVIPVFKNLRFVFKAYFLFLPLCIVPTAVFFKKIQKKSYGKIIYMICSVLALIGFANNYFVDQDSRNGFCMKITGRYDEEIAVLDKELDRVGLDRHNYRICSFVENSEEMENVFDCINKLQRNVPTTVHSFSLNGYDMTISQKSFEQSDSMMDNELMARYANVGLYYVFKEEDKGRTIEKIEQQILNNAVKYLIIDNEKDKIDLVTDFLKDMKTVTIQRSFPFMQGGIMLELDNIPALCTDDNGNDAALHSEMDILQFEVSPDSDYYRLSFTYKEQLKANYQSSDGKITKPLVISEDKDGYLLIKTDGLSDGTVTVTYVNVWIMIGNIFCIIVSILFFGLMIFLIVRKK